MMLRNAASRSSGRCSSYYLGSATRCASAARTSASKHQMLFCAAAAAAEQKATTAAAAVTQTFASRGFAASSLPAPTSVVVAETGGSESPLLKDATVRTDATKAALNPGLTAKVEYDYGNHDRLVNIPGDESKRAFVYMILSAGRMVYASSIRLAVLQFLVSMSASDDVLALANVEVDTSNIDMGQTVTIKWRGKPVFIKRRTPEDIAGVNAVDIGSLRDPQTDADRCRADPEWFVCLGVCTHLGCVPLPDAGDYQGWFCPCHGSHYDASGRIRKGPAPYNLEIPDYSFLDEKTLLIG